MKKQQKELNTLKKRHAKVSVTWGRSLDRRSVLPGFSCLFCSHADADVSRRRNTTPCRNRTARRWTKWWLSMTRRSSRWRSCWRRPSRREGEWSMMGNAASSASSQSFGPDVIVTLTVLHFRENNCSDLKKETAIKVETLTTDHKEKVQKKNPSRFVPDSLFTRLRSIWPHCTITVTKSYALIRQRVCRNQLVAWSLLWRLLIRCALQICLYVHYKYSKQNFSAHKVTAILSLELLWM